VFFGAVVRAPGQSLLDVEPPDVAGRYRRLMWSTTEGWYLSATAAFLEPGDVAPGTADLLARIATGPRAAR
jgi:hypothetical protein